MLGVESMHVGRCEDCKQFWGVPGEVLGLEKALKHSGMR